MRDHPGFVTPPSGVEPCPRRVRGTLGPVTVFDTTRAVYVWEHPRYPHYWIPLADVQAGLLVTEESTQESPWGTLENHGITGETGHLERVAKVARRSPIDILAEHVRFNWDALDAWFEEDEQIHVHPRNPYVRVDALRSTRSLRVALDGAVIAETSSPVMLFETGLPTRYYIDRSDIRFEYLIESPTSTACPYKGRTGQYWSAVVNGTTREDVAWAYDFPTVSCAAIAGLVAFYNEKVELHLDGRLLEGP